MSVVISETFGPTFQGEGPSTGRRAGFVRLGRCNLDCAWCDSSYTWDWKGKNGIVYDPTVELSREDVDDVVLRLVQMDVPLVVITGGEPMLQRRGLTALVERLADHHLDIEIETNGTQVPWPQLILQPTLRFNVSPKLDNSGCDPEQRYVPQALDVLAASCQARFKFVCVRPADLLEVDELVSVHDLNPVDVWIMPEGATEGAQQEHRVAIAEATLRRGYNLSGRLHVALWNDRRGV